MTLGSVRPRWKTPAWAAGLYYVKCSDSSVFRLVREIRIGSSSAWPARRVTVSSRLSTKPSILGMSNPFGQKNTNVWPETMGPLDA
jgi:hypothetical protein